MPNQHDHPVFHNFSHIFHRNIFSFISTPFLFEHGFPSGWMSQNIPISAGDRRRDEQELRSRPSRHKIGVRGHSESLHSLSLPWFVAGVLKRGENPFCFTSSSFIYPFSFLPPSEKKSKEKTQGKKSLPADSVVSEVHFGRAGG